MKPIIYIPRIIAQEGIDYLIERGFSVKIGTAIDEDTMCAEVKGCQGILVRTAQITRKVMQSEPELKIIARHGTGLDIIDVDAATELGIQVTNTPESNGPSVAELTIGGMISIARKIHLLSDSAKRGDFFFKNHCQGTELMGKTLGLIGFGNIGRQVSQIAALGFQMNVLVYHGHMHGKAIPDYVRLASWEELFQSSDFVSLHVPARPENIGMIGTDEFAMMKQSAFLINTARGKLVREAEMIQALQRHEIAGAFLDVLSLEPFSPDNPLLHMDQAIVTPHCGSNTKEALIRSGLHAAMDIEHFFNGEPVSWPVNYI